MSRNDILNSAPVDPEVTASDPSVPDSVIIFGGGGFIGSHLARMLHDRGVRSITVADLKAPADLGFDVEFVEVDVREPITVPGAWDVAYNLSAVHRTPGHADEEYFATNVAGAVNVTNFCTEHDIRSLVFTSSIAVYGPKEDLLTEESPTEPTSAYGKSKLLAEDIHHTWHADDPLRVLTIVRPAVIFGDGEHGNFDRLRGALRRHRFAYPGRKDTIKASGYVEELTRSIEWVRQQGASSVIYNFAYPERSTIEDVATTIARADGIKGPIPLIPQAPMLLAASFFEVLERAGLRTGVNRARIKKLVLSTNIFPKYLVDAGYPYETDLAGGVAAWVAQTPRTASVAVSA